MALNISELAQRWCSSIGTDFEYLSIIMVPSWLHLAEDSEQVTEEASLKPRSQLNSEAQNGTR